MARPKTWSWGLLGRLLAAACAACLLGAVLATAAGANGPAKSARTRDETGVQHLHFRFGPITVKPGQNNIVTSVRGVQRPAVNGWIVGIKPNLTMSDGTVPRVDIIHLHHGVWLNASRPDPTAPGLPERFFAAGEEKTIMRLPKGYGYPYKTTDRWVLNYMLHNLTPTAYQVYVTYDLDFIPASAPAATGIHEARPIWLDVQNGKLYPVFDVLKGSGHNGRFTYPDDAPNPYGTGPALATWTVDRDGVLLATAGHLHPGGLHDDLWLRRPEASAGPGSKAAAAVQGDRAHLFRSTAKYYEPAGAVSWDVSMTATRPDWRVGVHKGDALSISTTYDSKRAAWYESMGIMVAWMADGPGPDPYATRVDRPGRITHGHLAENRHHGGNPTKWPDAGTLANGPQTSTVNAVEFEYAPGGVSLGLAPPVVKQGQSLTFANLDAPLENGIWHTITACKAPCNRGTGVAYPLADANIEFDSGELGVGGPPASGRTTWQTPADLPPGTYTYFCRIHPSMRGAFRVVTG